VTEAATQLDYAPPRSTSWRVRLRRALMVLGVVLLFTGGVWVAPRAFRHAQVTYWQRQCMTYRAKPDFIVHASDRAAIPQLLQPGSGYLGSLPSGHAFLVPPAYRSFVGSAIASRSFGTAFLHRRKSPGGAVRLVAVDLQIFNIDKGTKYMVLMPTVFEPSGLVSGPRNVPTRATGNGTQVFVMAADAYTIYAGQPDHADESHFTIDFAFNGVRHTLDGWLKDDDSVQIERRD
jgi:hypothetical protein